MNTTFEACAYQRVNYMFSVGEPHINRKNMSLAPKNTILVSQRSQKNQRYSGLPFIVATKTYPKVYPTLATPPEQRLGPTPKPPQPPALQLSIALQQDLHERFPTAEQPLTVVLSCQADTMLELRFSSSY